MSLNTLDSQELKREWHFERVNRLRRILETVCGGHAEFELQLKLDGTGTLTCGDIAEVSLMDRSTMYRRHRRWQKEMGNLFIRKLATVIRDLSAQGRQFVIDPYRFDRIAFDHFLCWGTFVPLASVTISKTDGLDEVTEFLKENHSVLWGGKLIYLLVRPGRTTKVAAFECQTERWEAIERSIDLSERCYIEFDGNEHKILGF